MSNAYQFKDTDHAADLFALKEAGVSEDLIYLSVGIEHIDDLVEDLEQAIKEAAGLHSAAVNV